MNTQRDYKGIVIETNPEELTDGSGLIESYIIKINRFEGTWYGSDRKFPTRDAANAASILAAKHTIDRSQSKLGQDRDQDGVVPPDLSATWNEDDNLRRTGDGVLRYTKNKRCESLDELDGEPE